MNSTKSLSIAAAVLATCASAVAQSSWGERIIPSPHSATFGPHEFSLDVAGGYASRNKNGDDESAWGTVVGVNYFIWQNIGVGVDTYADAFTVPYLLNFNGIYRYPIKDMGLAPYAFVGFGRQWKYDPRWTGDIGGGVEYRFNRNTGVFLDGRGVFGDQTYALWRFGFRLAF